MPLCGVYRNNLNCAPCCLLFPQEITACSSCNVWPTIRTFDFGWLLDEICYGYYVIGWHAEIVRHNFLQSVSHVSDSLQCELMATFAYMPKCGNHWNHVRTSLTHTSHAHTSLTLINISVHLSVRSPPAYCMAAYRDKAIHKQRILYFL